MADPKLQKEVDKLVQEEMSNRLQNEVDGLLKQPQATEEPAKSTAKAASSGETEGQGQDGGYSYGMGQ